ncbi:hypothetical protein F5883DRAFT_514074 [Diaporthe sp. PMI_573]|nr:hypothetical protein F5883DRAFT_514074 [Diaporthaceae sp. PMI_573]
MPSRRDSRGKSSPDEDDAQGECYPGQQHPETDLSSGAPSTSRRVADHPNRDCRVMELDPSYTPPGGRGRGRDILPSQVEAVIHATADQVDEVIEQVKNLEQPPRPRPSESGTQVDPRQLRTTSQDPRGKSANARQGLVDREPGMSLDGSPNCNMEEADVSGLLRRESSHASDTTTVPDTPSSRSSSGSAEPSAPAMDDASLHKARAVRLRPFRRGRLRDGEPGEHRPPSPAALDRIDEMLEGVTRAWTDVALGTAAQTQASEEDEDGMLTGDSDMTITPLDRGPATRGEGQLRSPRSSGPHYTQGYPAGVNSTQPPRVSPTPSEFSTAETVFNVRRPTPPPPRPDTAYLPGSRRQEAAARAWPSGGLRRGGSYPAADVGQGESVPAVLVPGGLLGLGGSHPRPPPVSRRQGRRGSGEDEKRQRHDARKE